jgi:RNA recognition motif-containing protein
MVEKIKRLDGLHCLGETLKVRRVNEETAQTNAQAAAITLAALKSLTTGNSDPELNMKASTLKTVNVSCVIKLSNLFDREEEMTPEIYEDMKEDMEAEFSKVPHLKRVKVIRNGEEKLGAEVGSVFVELRDKKSAELGLKMMKGRIYDGREIKVSFIDEKLYYSELTIV